MVPKFSQICSLNMSGKIFDTMGVPGGGYISQTCSSKTPKIFKPHFFSNGCGVDDGVSRRLEFQKSGGLDTKITYFKNTL